jgi:hypothetical protein
VPQEGAWWVYPREASRSKTLKIEILKGFLLLLLGRVNRAFPIITNLSTGYRERAESAAGRNEAAGCESGAGIA